MPTILPPFHKGERSPFMQQLSRALLLLVFAALPLSAQTIRGTVTLADGSPLPGVTVSIDALGVSTVTDAEGKYVLTVTPPRTGSVAVSANLQGFQTRTANVDLGRGDAT